MCLTEGQNYKLKYNSGIDYQDIQFSLTQCKGPDCYSDDVLKMRLTSMVFGVISTQQVFSSSSYSPDPIIYHDLVVSIPASHHIVSGDVVRL